MGITATMNKLRHRVYKCNDVLFTFFYSDIIYYYMYPVDLEDNERSCEYWAIVVPTSKDIVTQPRT
jgi:hypothetical protein